jgi:transcriptional regulator with XRE-family HTH domain
MDFAQIGLRIRGLRESCDISREELAAELEVTPETLAQWEETGADVPISAIYHIANRFGVDLSEVLTGTGAKLDTYQVVRAGEGRSASRNPAYRYQDLAWLFGHKIMQPLLVTLDPSVEAVEPRTHGGQEFNLVLSGTVIVSFGDRELVLEPGDSIYFNPALPHAQRAGGDAPATFVTVIAE